MTDAKEIGAYVLGTLDAVASVDRFTRGAQQNLINQLIYMHAQRYGGDPQFKVDPSPEQTTANEQNVVQQKAEELFAAQKLKAEQAVKEVGL